eukprot:TRINITY_DN67161_c0_g1_i1.p1 TRINITY_DN67161_c0_g1~~TRINITY_DN67161_c0_g1_i1.p1  ORF type:complete len:351 (+),score=18.43 TRINITY_DN67161_c0_g1_i1:68-1120(+)
MICYISSRQHNRRLSCNWFTNSPFTTGNREGWERWCIADVGDGNISIQSMDRKRYLGSNSEGHVFTHHMVGTQEQWRVEKSPHAGSFVKSAKHGKRLACDSHGHIYTHDNRGGWETWVLEFVRNVRVSSVKHDIRLSCNWFNHKPFSTRNRAGWEEWRLVYAGDAKVFLQSKDRHRFLGSNAAGHLFTHHTVGIQETWILEDSPCGGFFIKSTRHGKHLACNAEGNLYTHANRGGWETWVLEDAPNDRGVAGGFVTSLVLGSLGAIMAPCAAVGVVGALGFGTGGIVAGSAAAGMMSAEAIAAGGGVAAGGLVATLQSVGAVGLCATAATGLAAAGGSVGIAAGGIVDRR